MWQHVEAKRHVFPAALGPTSKTSEIESTQNGHLWIQKSDLSRMSVTVGKFWRKHFRYTTAGTNTYRNQKQRFITEPCDGKNAANTWLQMCSYAVPNPKSRVYCPGFLKKGRSMSRSKRNHFQESNAP